MPESFTDIRNSVAELLRLKNDKAADRAVEALVEAEINERAETIRKGIDLYASLTSAHASIRPKSSGYTTDGTPLQASFSHDDFKRRGKIEEALKNLDVGLGRAMNDADYKPLRTAINNHAGLASGGNKAQKEPEAPPED